MDTPVSSTPSTPTDDHGNRPKGNSDPVTIEGDDYFMSVARFAAGDSKSVPGTPRSLIARNISFSPRIQFHDTWTSMDYDRRGEIATCNRLTPMLAQQIKEELNTFKMVYLPRYSNLYLTNAICRKWRSTNNRRCTRTSSNRYTSHHHITCRLPPCPRTVKLLFIKTKLSETISRDAQMAFYGLEYMLQATLAALATFIPSELPALELQKLKKSLVENTCR